MRTSALIIGTLALTACASQTDAGWTGYRNNELSISFSRPTSYIPGEVIKEDLQFGRGTIPIQHAYLRPQLMPESPAIEVLKSDDPRIINYFTMNHPFEEMTIGNKVVKIFRWDGMGDPVGYVFRERPWVAIIFLFPPTEGMMHRVVETAEVK